MEDEEMSELTIIGTTSLSAITGKCDVESCGATGVVLVKASLAALQYYLSHVENYEKMSLNICKGCHEKVEFFKKAKELALKGDCLLSMNEIPEFLKAPHEVIDLESDDDNKLHPSKKRKDLGRMHEVDQAIRKVLKKMNLPEQFSKGVAQVKADMDRLEEDLKPVRNDIISFCNVYNSLIADITPKVEIRTVGEVTIDSDGTVTKKRLRPVARMKSVATDSPIEIIEEIIMLDKEPGPPDDEFDEDEIEQIEEKKQDKVKTLQKCKILHRPCPEEGWLVIAPYRDGTTKTHCWVHGTVAEVVSEEHGLIIVKFDSTLGKVTEQVPLRKVAYFAVSDFILPTELRVVVVTERTCSCPSIRHYQPGIIIESKRMVDHDSQYLVYLDSGECRYFAHKDVRIMCDGRLDEFLKERVCTNPETDEYFKFIVRRLAMGGGLPRIPRKFRNGVVVVLRDGKWQIARIEVEKVDDCKSDVVKVQFENDVEWLFRGSPRFHQVLPNFKPEPRIEYPGWYGEDEMRKREELLDEQYMENCLESCLGFEGVIRTLEFLDSETTSAPLGRHGECDETCAPKYTPSLPNNQLSYRSPLTIPLHLGWQRTLSRNQNVMYVSPCGKKFCNFKSLFEYVRVTQSDLHVDWFCFDLEVDVSKEFVVEGVKLNVKDISRGLENIQIPCVNSVDEDPMPVFEYTPECVPGDDVFVLSKLDADEFIQCCDCTDNCSNYNICACRRLTVEGNADAVNSMGRPPETWFSYVKNRKLMYKFDSGIFECGKRCGCQKNLCTNRVVQNGMQWPLIVFKTKNKGWAVRAACDIPRGTFICVYAGALNTEDVGSKIEETIGDEYSLSLKFLETFEQYNQKYKPGYEAFVIEEHQHSFIINPKKVGNVGRFFSHSCNPNMFLQHVFVHTHDPRFPQHAFFTSSVVKAGSELTWDYKYEIDGDGEVKIPCYCGAFNCRKRLL